MLEWPGAERLAREYGERKSRFAVIVPDDERRTMRRWYGAAIELAAFLMLAAAPAQAQTEYYNTDRGRPLRIEDAYVTERHAVELKLSSLRLERDSSGVYDWGIEPEVAWGFLPRTQLEIGVPLVFRESGAQRQSGMAGLDISLMHNLNVETRTWPALALRADVLAPVGGLAPARAYPSFTGIATRTYHWARVHLNGQYTVGDEIQSTSAADVGAANPAAPEFSRWLAGIALDQTFPLQSTLLGGEFFARQSLVAGEPVEYNAGAGVRYQVSPTLALDGGIGLRTNGDATGWYVTFGSAYSFGLVR